MRLLETDLLDIVDACIDKKLSQLEVKWKNLSACTVVLASGGYPGNYEKGKVITGIVPTKVGIPTGVGKDVVIFRAGTAIKDGKLITNGGRGLGVSSVGKSLEESLGGAYKAIEKISFEGMQYRK